MKIEELRSRVSAARADVLSGQQRLLGQAQDLRSDLRKRLQAMMEDIRRPNDRFM